MPDPCMERTQMQYSSVPEPVHSCCNMSGEYHAILRVFFHACGSRGVHAAYALVFKVTCLTKTLHAKASQS